MSQEGNSWVKRLCEQHCTYAPRSNEDYFTPE